jgi:hypothetical protein
MIVIATWNIIPRYKAAQAHPTCPTCRTFSVAFLLNAHRAHRAGNHHALGKKSLAKYILRKLAEKPDNGCEPLGKQGARGALFRLTLESYGYTFVAKGTLMAFKAELKYEGLVYRHLDEVQGELIPVYLGNGKLSQNIIIRPSYTNHRCVHPSTLVHRGLPSTKSLVPAIYPSCAVHITHSSK